MDKCVAPDWLMCWTMDLEVWFRNLTASFFFCSWDRHWSLAEPLSPFMNFRKSWQIAGGANLRWTVQLKKQCSPTFRFQRNWDKLQQWFPDSLRVWQSIFPPPFTLYWRQLILLPFPLKTMWYLQKIIRPPSPSDRSPKVSFHLTEKDWGASQLYCPCWVSCGCWGFSSTGVKSLRICSSYSTRPRYARFYGSTVADIDQVCLIRVPFNSYRVWCFVSSMASWMTRYFPTLLVQLWCKFDAEYRILLYSLWRSSELMAYAVKPRHSEL